MKQSISPAVMIGAFVVAAVAIVGVYLVMFREPSHDMKPGVAKAMQSKGKMGLFKNPPVPPSATGQPAPN